MKCFQCCSSQVEKEAKGVNKSGKKAQTSKSIPDSPQKAALLQQPSPSNVTFLLFFIFGQNQWTKVFELHDVFVSKSTDGNASKPKKAPAPEPPSTIDGLKDVGKNNIAAQSFSFRELGAATKNFRRESLLGEGGFGRVYKGILPKTGQANPPVIYRDMKCSNILLDGEFNARLSDFGLAKLGPVGDKTHAAPMFKVPSRFPQLADPLLKGEFPKKGLHQAVAVAAMCLRDDAAVRPTMNDVVIALSFLGNEPTADTCSSDPYSESDQLVAKREFYDEDSS
ncbi:hypothetical protein V6N11_010497 [Hibiscus sabdariffa]|uniref:Protein kinase domain-containing protein n=1 Tax=Hibiscus sabdariffa TaxID=183260 RepID=A0ABR2S5P0_9ROSI